MTEWTLERAEEFYEENFGHYLRPSLPSYEVFWTHFVVPLTKRPQGIGFRSGVDLLLQRMASAHYSMFWHLVASHRLLATGQECPDTLDLSFDSILFHLSAATEMVDDFLFMWAQIEGCIRGHDVFGDTLTLNEPLREFLSLGEYGIALKKFRQHGRPVNITLHAEVDVFDPFLQRAGEAAIEAYGKFKSTADKIRHYRNVVAHNPRLAKVVRAGVLRVPKESKLSDYDDWEKVRKQFRGEDLSEQTSSASFAISSSTSTTFANDFVPASNLAETFLEQVETAINDLWQRIVPYCQDLADSPAYCRMAAGSIEKASNGQTA